MRVTVYQAGKVVLAISHGTAHRRNIADSVAILLSLLVE
jgi:hypothetical protein